MTKKTGEKTIGIRYLKFWGINPVWIELYPNGSKSMTGKVGFYKQSITKSRISAQDLIDILIQEDSIIDLNSLLKRGERKCLVTMN